MGMAEAGEVATGIDTTVPHSARIWNYWLGGKDNYPVDREAGDQFAAAFPQIRVIAQVSRAFLQRAIGYLAGEAAVTQFLDVGTGLPTSDNTHEIAQRANPRARVVYVDNDPLVLAHANALLTSSPQGTTDYLHADLYQPDAITAQAGEILDFRKPVAVNLSGVLGHVIDTEQARSIISRLLAPLPAGSYLVINDSVNEPVDEAFEAALRGYGDTGAIPYVLRSPREFASLFTDLEPVEPGIVVASAWRPRPGADQPAVAHLGAVGRKP
jgi:SAM-dependent methyltransferase